MDFPFFLYGCDAHLLRVEGFDFLNSFIQHGRDGRHRENHGGNLLVDSKEEMINEGDFV